MTPRSLSSNSKPVLIDYYCCQGGATRGYQQAGFEVWGVDINQQPRYCGDRFILRDALQHLRDVAAARDYVERYGIVGIHASPPCQHDSATSVLNDNEHPDLIEPTRELLLELGLPYVIENVRGALPKLRDPIELCGTMFGLEMYRHRYFETNWQAAAPLHPTHFAPQVKMGRAPKPGEYIQAVGNFSGVQKAREVMEIPWANRDGLREAIPPAYTRWIGRQLMTHLAELKYEEAA